MADERIKYVIEVDSAGATRSVKDFTDATDQQNISFTELNQATELISKAFSGLETVVKSVFSALDRASEIEGLTRSFENLQQSIGATASTSLAELNTATLGLVDNLSLMQQANQAVLLGVDDGTGKFDDMAAAAVKLGAATGRTATEALGDLITGIGRASPLILDNLGITVKAEEAYRAWAAANGVLVKDMSETEKKLAFQAAAIEQVTEKAAKLPEVAETAGIAFDRLQVTFSNFVTENIKALSANEGLTSALNEFDKVLKSIDVQEVVSALADLTVVTLELLGPLLKAAEYLAKLGAAVVRFPIKTVRDIAAALGSLSTGVSPTRLSVDEQINAITQAFQAAQSRIDLKPIVQDIDNLNTRLKILGIQDEYLVQVSALLDLLDDLDATLPDVALQIDGSPTSLGDSLDRLANKTKAAKDEALELAKAYMEAGLSLQDFLDDGGLGKPSGSRGSANLQNTTSIIDDFVNELFGPLGEAVTAISQSIQAGIADALSVAFAGGNSDDFGNVARKFGADLGGKFAGPIGSVLGEQLAGGIFDAFDHAFGGGGDPENEARKQVDRFFAEVFERERLQVIIDGQLQDLFDLDFGGDDGFNNGAGFGFLQSLEADTQAAFSGIGNALNQLLETGEDIGSQLAAVLANNLGGSLNNLQIAIQTLGFSAEQMKEAIVDAFLQGKISAIEAHDAFAATEQLFEQGIPGATGATVEAFNNLIASGGRGRVAIDGLVDIFAEAKEKGITTFEELREELIAAGESVEEVDKLFQTLAEQGITSIDQILTASIEQLINVLAGLEAKDFAFTEQVDEAADKVDELITKLENAPTEITTKWRIETQVTGDRLPDGFPGGGVVESNNGAPGVV